MKLGENNMSELETETKIINPYNERELKKWLNRAFYAEKKIKVLDMLVMQYRSRAEGLSRAGGAGCGGASYINRTENAILKYADMSEKLDKQKIELSGISEEISAAIAKLHDDDLETVLIHRYLLFHTIEQTAELMNYSPETVKRKQRKAIQKLTPFDLV